MANQTPDFSVSGIRARKEQHAIETCAGLYMERGIDAVKMTDIADACGIGVATLYRYFGTKPGITLRAATYLWKQIHHIFAATFESEHFQQMTGCDQLSALLHMFLTLYKEQGAFVKFLWECDNFLASEKTAEDDLLHYEAAVVDFYPVCEAAYKKGLADGSLREIPDFYLYYCTFTHGLMALSQKFIRGEILPGDDFTKADAELKMMIDAALMYIKSI